MQTHPRLKAGCLVVHRGFARERLIHVQVARVVSHDDDALLLWFEQGTPTALSIAQDGRSIRDVPFGEWITLEQQLVIQCRAQPGLLMRIPAGRSHSVWWQWRPDGSFWGWYVNLEEPSVLWDDGEIAGVDTVDQDLDLWVLADNSWRWKDEHELAERSEFPAEYWVDDPNAVRAEGHRLIGLVERRVFPFDGTWCDFRPDPAWTWPEVLPTGWDRPRARTS